jgi:hypothetical protein
MKEGRRRRGKRRNYRRNVNEEKIEREEDARRQYNGKARRGGVELK